MNPALRRTATWVTVVQLLLNLNWALYVAFLPALMTVAGLDPRLAIVLLMVDQATFAAADWAAGVHADRLARTLGRIGPTVTLFAVASSAALLALPWLAGLGMAWLMVAATIAWTVTSSALRAPVFTLLGRVAGAARPPGTVSLALTGVGVAGAIAPLVTQSLAQVDPRLPLGVGAATLALAALVCSRIERSLPKPPAAAPTSTASPASAPPDRVLGALAIAVIALGAAIGTQLHTVSLAAPLRADGLAWISWWAPMFWMGFALGTIVAAWVGRNAPQHAAHDDAQRGETVAFSGIVALLVGAAALLAAPLAPGFESFAAAQGLAGAAWAVFMSAAVRTALDRGGGRGAGGALGMIFSALALAALARLALAAIGWKPTMAANWIAAATWLLAAIAFAAAAAHTGPRAARA
jgi:hypothetical protein